MPSIKDLKKRITSTKNTQQTTKAMKMVSAAKLRRATDAIISQRPYAQEIARLMRVLSAEEAESDSGLKSAVSLLVVVSSDRGLCGGYNSTIIRAATNFINEKQKAGRAVKTFFVGKKAYELLRGRFNLDLVHYEEFGQKVTFRKATEIAKKAAPLFEEGNVDEVVLVFNEFKNAITQEVRTEKVLPLSVDKSKGGEELVADKAIYVPNKKELYASLASKYFTVQVFKALLEGQASEHGARMSAMESATKNAGEMIKKLTLQYNKQRQAGITKELLEIISGSESQKTQG
ncbi:MAG: ATP synthase F1 subunit gamma [Bdellovibrionales bacterium]|nr:ATP synthase F1 subunit gamma [Bdellovibrionales bacterium]